MAGLFANTAAPGDPGRQPGDGLRRAAERLPVTRKVVHRFVPGETIDQRAG